MNTAHTIRTYALIAVAVTTAALIGFAWWLIDILSAPDWCNRAVGAVKYTNGRPESAITGCYGLMSAQVKALALNSHMAIGTLALCLAVLVVIVLAGGKMSFKVSKDGADVNVSRDAAQSVADAAQEQANDVNG